MADIADIVKAIDGLTVEMKGVKEVLAAQSQKLDRVPELCNAHSETLAVLQSLELGPRLTKLEMWKARLIGAWLVAGLVGGSGFTLLIVFIPRWLP